MALRRGGRPSGPGAFTARGVADVDVRGVDRAAVAEQETHIGDERRADGEAQAHEEHAGPRTRIRRDDREGVGNERAREPARAGSPRRSVLAALLGAVDLDLLLGHGVGHLALLLDGLLVQAHALLGHRALLHDRLLGVERDLVLLLGDRGAVGRVVEVGVGDRLALDADLLALHRHRRLHLVGDDVLAQAGAARLTLRLADVELLLGARHGVVRGRARRVAAHGALRALGALG